MSSVGIDLERENLIEIKERIRLCRDSRDKLIREVRELNERCNDKLISKEGYDNFLNERFNGRSRLEWIDFCDRYIEEKERLICGRKEKDWIQSERSIRDCKDSKEELIEEINEINERFENKLINKQEY